VACGIEVVWDVDSPNQATVDHVVPLSKGGMERLDNMQLMCRRCNQAKGDVYDLD
jgi:5-methylcytosine-specific restriction endonuclease McrA